MYYSEDIINKIGTDKELAIRLDKAMSGVKEEVIDYLNNLGDAATRLLYYSSCLTKNYHDVCTRLKDEDVRFVQGLGELVIHRNLIFRMIKIYIETVLKSKNEVEKKSILERLTLFTKNISIKTFSKSALIYSIVSYICYGNKMNDSVEAAFVKKIGARAGIPITALNLYSIVNKASESANRLKIFMPQFYHALYVEKLEMMYFLIEPIIMKAGYLNINTASNIEITNALKRMM
ncbi:hypothetical protein [Enterobacter hormaechei]|uniref:hypothetical protein n=1 Tax=Enterobacter hormaechei TaxID=158836 RepID=UPI0035258CFB